MSIRYATTSSLPAAPSKLRRWVKEVELSFVEYLASKKVHLRPDIVEYSKGEQPPLYDLIIGK